MSGARRVFLNTLLVSCSVSTTYLRNRTLAHGSGLVSAGLGWAARRDLQLPRRSDPLAIGHATNIPARRSKALSRGRGGAHCRVVSARDRARKRYALAIRSSTGPPAHRRARGLRAIRTSGCTRRTQIGRERRNSSRSCWRRR
jgi:hypothetical protein